MSADCYNTNISPVLFWVAIYSCLEPKGQFKVTCGRDYVTELYTNDVLLDCNKLAKLLNKSIRFVAEEHISECT